MEPVLSRFDSIVANYHDDAAATAVSYLFQTSDVELQCYFLLTVLYFIDSLLSFSFSRALCPWVGWFTSAVRSAYRNAFLTKVVYVAFARGRCEMQRALQVLR